MDLIKQNLIVEIVKEFQLADEIKNIVPYGTGHINDTYLITTNKNGQEKRTVFQRINHHVFRDPQKLMENFCNITAHQAAKYLNAGRIDVQRRVLEPLTRRNGDHHVYDEEGYLWRATPYIGNTITYQIVNTQHQAFEVGRSYGQFQQLMLDFPTDLIHETITEFHNTPSRLDILNQAIKRDKQHRVFSAKYEIDFIEHHQNWVNRIADALDNGKLPTRIIHNDTKVNNLLMDKQSLEGICVTDLDTTMPGTVLYDFGDMVRTSTNTAPEDEIDVSKVKIDLGLFEAMTTGYLNASRNFITDFERSHLVFSGKLITFELAIRFLTDFLEGDRYFKIEYPDHNLIRCRSQLALVKAIGCLEDEMEEIVNKV